MPFKYWFFLALPLFSLFMVPSIEAEDNLVINGGFEKTNAAGVPIGWQIQKIGGAIISLDGDSYSGEKAILIDTYEAPGQFGPDVSSKIGQIIQQIPIEPKSYYLMNFWYKFDHVSEDELKYIVFDKPTYLRSATKWTRAMKLFESGYEYDLDLIIELYRRTSKVWIDEVRLMPLTSTTNYLFNPDFEEVRKDGTPTWWTINKAGSPMIKVENAALYGDRCLSMEGHPTLNPPKNYPTSETAVVSQAVPLKHNTLYDLIFWYQTKNLSDVFKVELLGKQYFLPHNANWTRKVITINSGNNDKTDVKFILYQRTGKVWVDHVEFSEALK